MSATATAGMDLLSGRPTPAIGSTEAKLQQRKLDALKRGIHRIKDSQTLPYGVHMIGVGGAGARIIEQVLRDAPQDLLAVPGSRLSALAIDIGDQDLGGVKHLAEKFGADQTHIETVALAMPDIDQLQASLQRYRDFLKLEYPMYHAQADHQSWLEADTVLPKAGQPMPRAVAKALYGQSYYDGERPLSQALRRFARSVEASSGDAVVCIIFGLGGGSGSGMALDLARHLSNAIFGRRVLVAGIGIAPCDGDRPEHGGAQLFPVLNELDCLGDEEKNRGIVMSCGDLYKNPFTAGFMLVPQQAAWQACGSLLAAQSRINREIAALLTLRQGANLWEMLRLLNWLAAPSTQHSAARTPWGAKWIHMLACIDAGAQLMAPGFDLPSQMGLLPGFTPEFIEMRVANVDDAQTLACAGQLMRVFTPEVPPQIIDGGAEHGVQFILPRICKTDLALFHVARAAYDAAPAREKRLAHALLLEQGVLLCEPSTRLEDMAGASLWGQRWVAVTFHGLRGEKIGLEELVLA